MQTYLQTLTYEELRIRWKNYVATLDVNESTKNTMCTDALYLFRRNNKDLFWQVVLAENFEESAKINIINTFKILIRNESIKHILVPPFKDNYIKEA